MLVSVRSAVAQDCYVIEARYVQMSEGRHMSIFSSFLLSSPLTGLYAQKEPRGLELETWHVLNVSSEIVF